MSAPKNLRSILFHHSRKLRWSPIVILLALAFASAFALHTFAQGPTATYFTGCLRTNGTLYKVAFGSTPPSTPSCMAGDPVVNWSDGDIHAVLAGAGLIGGGNAGEVVLSANTSVLQSRVTGVCPPGESIRVINSNGSVVCEPDSDTTYAAGAGLNLTGNQFSLADGGVTTQKLANNNVTTAKLADGAVTTPKLAPNAAAVLPQIRLRKTSNQPIPFSIDTAVAWDIEDFKTDIGHSNTTNNTRITINTPGVYLLQALVRWAFNGAGGRKACGLDVNGVHIPSTGNEVHPGPVSSPTTLTCSTQAIVRLAAGNYVEVNVFQQAASSLDVSTGGSPGEGDAFEAIMLSAY